ncbi:hypothetical protein ASPNIDRAFT_37801 [Aspergillus niger ATCC 1015]|uniref:Uncharacterized protein n=2 Tax=Aspergillus niger TaxID=5061 RepID=G3YGB5_ASPNA|nr:uncharacterized protein BO96DRAFT_347730 [Aspergillus niger CBS 101883]EHA18596.1 hypothetical protein ASPNIDRAFT_37801 [Aspergillus niger ATCC 1015]PYH52480.1 hypothetical protein BO96DRAFT_347730 [Aspergillus niger CBS 101883]RDH19310.1 hypothetical protein M747DRAFT_323817 [Aspergillus niger ATCC 13496]
MDGKRHSYHFWLLLGLTVTFLGVLAVSFLRMNNGADFWIPWLRVSHISCDSGALGPYLETFSYHRSESEVASPDPFSAKWMDSSSTGFVQIHEAGGKTKHYGVSMFHQLHCLESLKMALKHESHHTRYWERRGEGEGEGEDHLEHCLQYLEQAIMCAADDTIEPSFVAELPTGEKARIINGDGVVHRCRNFDEVQQAMILSEKNPLVLQRRLGEGDTLRMIMDSVR